MIKNDRKSLIDLVLSIGIIMGILLGFEISYGYFGLSIFSFLALYLVNRWNKKKEKEMYVANIRAKWGEEHLESRSSLDMKKLFHYNKEERDLSFFLDDISWRDFNMDQVFKKMDHSKSLPGMQYLYDIMRRPVFNEDILKDRDRKINLYMENKDIAQEIQYPLAVLGKEEGAHIFDYFSKGIEVGRNLLPIYTMLSYIPFIILLGFFINRTVSFILLVILLVVNNLVYQRNKRQVFKEMESFQYLGRLILAAEKISKINTEGLDTKVEDIKYLLKKTRALRKNIFKLSVNEESTSEFQILIHYYNMVMLKEPKIFYKAVDQMNEFREDMFQLYRAIGEIDFYIAIASYKSSLDHFTRPVLEKGDRAYLQAEDLYHPLLEEPVPYSFSLDGQGALVTGSNASGKSTFLRAIGINVILAQSLYFTLAKTYTSSYFKLLSSIGTTDSIVKGDSYFMSEAKSLKRIIDSLEENYPVLCILDEIFRGTNTTERINMALEVLNYMMDRNSLVIAATHDLELTNLVDDKYGNYHFKETIEDRDIKFDYQLRKGPSKTRNAIAILKYLDYPREIYENAEIKAREFEEETVSK